MDQPYPELFAGGAPVVVPAAAGAGRRHLAAQTRCHDLGCKLGDRGSEGVDLLEQLRRRLIEIERVFGYHDVADRMGYAVWFRALSIDQVTVRSAPACSSTRSSAARGRNDP